MSVHWAASAVPMEPPPMTPVAMSATSTTSQDGRTRAASTRLGTGGTSLLTP